MSNKICKECGRDIEVEHLYPCGIDKDGRYTCRVCSYKKDMDRVLPELTEKIRRFFQRNLDAEEARRDERGYYLCTCVECGTSFKSKHPKANICDQCAH